MKILACACGAHVDFSMCRPSYRCRPGLRQRRWGSRPRHRAALHKPGFRRLRKRERRRQMPDSRYRWVIVAAGGLMGCIAIGAMFSLPVFLRSIARDTGWSMTGISGAMTLGFIAMAFASMAWGSLSDRIGTRAVAVTGAVLLSASL
ncbi:MFS transporter, partial [Burkholderia stabilis]